VGFWRFSLGARGHLPSGYVVSTTFTQWVFEGQIKEYF